MNTLEIAAIVFISMCGGVVLGRWLEKYRIRRLVADLQYIHMGLAKIQGCTIDTCASGRPVAYKGERFKPTYLNWCYTELESKLLSVYDL